jgi:hypothetical protein
LTGRHVRANPIGVFGAAWGDSGLHNETFWLGWSAIAQYAWTPGIPPVDQHIAAFLRLYYGPEATGLPQIYRKMQRQARAWQSSWDRMVSKARAPGYGNSYGKGVGTARYDMTLFPPPLPSMPDLALSGSFREKYKKFIEDAKPRAIENDDLILAIQDNFPRVSQNRYNLEVFLSLARFMGHHWDLLLGLADAERSLEQAAAAHASKNPGRAVGLMVAAYNRTGQATQDLKRVFKDLTETFEKSRFPKGQSVGGRRFLHVLDDTKDHWADRRPDLTYMTAPEESMELEKWRMQLSEIIRSYAKQHNVPVRGLEAARLEE